MADHEHENEPRLFTLSEAERTRVEVEPLLIEAVEKRRQMGERAELLQQIASRIALSGGMILNYEEAAKLRAEHDHLGRTIQDALERIHATGCVVKDLDMGLLDFPAIVDNEEVYLCWRLGEDRIRFYHRQDEGFSGRKPLDPNDPGPSPVQ
ncbi:MAG TPA: DUF2203 domain-containing protein [Candidatus Acidoferrales bacterium]